MGERLLIGERRITQKIVHEYILRNLTNRFSIDIADLAASDEIKIEHLAEAIQYRSLDRAGWAG